jgi:HEAT repeat protein
MNAVSGLGYTHTRDAVPILIELLRDPDRNPIIRSGPNGGRLRRNLANLQLRQLRRCDSFAVRNARAAQSYSLHT